jgi:hypothetical protein
MMAMEILRKEREQERKATSDARVMAEKEAKALEIAEREARLKIEQEREMARIRAERALAEAEAFEKREAIQTAVQAEVERLKNRTSLEILQDEVAELKHLIVDSHPLSLIDSLQNEISELKRQIATLVNLNGSYTFNRPRCIQIHANNGVLGIDPAHGHGKVLEVRYCTDSIRDDWKRVNEHEELLITGNGLQILEAKWGCNAGSADVTLKIKTLLCDM